MVPKAHRQLTVCTMDPPFPLEVHAQIHGCKQSNRPVEPTWGLGSIQQISMVLRSKPIIIEIWIMNNQLSKTL